MLCYLLIYLILAASTTNFSLSGCYEIDNFVTRFLLDREALTVLCSVVNYAESGTKEVKGETRDVVEFLYHFLSALAASFHILQKFTN